MTEKEPRLGTAEKAALGAALAQGGAWTKASGWVWENLHWTLMVFGRLARKGLAEETKPDEEYSLTPRGRTLAKELAKIVPPTRPRKPSRPVQWPAPGSYRLAPRRTR